VISSLLVDTGPLVALLHRDDAAHARCVRVLKRTSSPLCTTWPVVTEATYLLSFSHEAQDGLLEMLDRGDLLLLPLEMRDVPRLRTLIRKYRDLPMELADASLVDAAEREGVDTVFTLDSRDFSVYRLPRGKRFTIVP